MKITITLITIALFIILIFILKSTNKEPYDTIINAITAVRDSEKKDLKDLRGSWHLKDWTCPHCKYQNVTVLTSNKL